MNIQQLLDKLTNVFDYSPAVDSEYRGITEDLLYQDNIEIVQDEEVEVIRLSPDFVIYKNKNNIWRFLKYSDQQGAGGNDLYTRVGSDTLFSSEYNRENATLSSGVYNYADFHNEAYNKIRFLKSGTYATGYFDLKSLEDSKISSYATDDLPRNLSNGSLAFDTTIFEHVYFIDGRWYKLSDKSLVIDLISDLEVYLFSGQSNAGGTTTDGTANLSNYDQLDNDGSTLANDQINVLIQSNYGSTNLDPQILKVGSYQGDSHGLEVSFLDGISNVRSDKKQMVVKYASGGSKIETWSKSDSNSTNSANPINNWDRLINSVNYTIQWAAQNHYTLDWKGFIWWQGESDKGRVSSEHQTDLETLISNVRTSLNKAELPVCLIQTDNRVAEDSMGANSVRTSGTDNIRQAHVDTANADEHVEVIETLPYINYFNWQATSDPSVWDGVHWKTEAHVEIGYDTATKMNQMIEGNWVMPDTLLWLDASDTSTVTHNSATTQRVSEWRDKSGNNYHASQSTVSYQFAYNTSLLNGKNTMAGELNRAMRSSNPTSATFRDVFIVARWDGSDNFNNFNALFTGGVHNNDNQGIQGTNSNKKLFNNNPFFNRIILNGSVHSIADDILDIMKTPFIINVSDTRVVDRLVSGYAVGADRSLSSREWVGIIAEIVVFDNVLEEADRIAMEGFLAHKWGLTDALPSDHTYKSEEP